MQKIIDIYLNKWVNIWQYEEVCMGSIWFDAIDLHHLLSLLKEEKILIQVIELFEKESLNFMPPDFWSEDDDIKENYIQVDNFLESIKNNLNKNYLALTFRDENLEKEVNDLLRIKYAVKTSKDEQLKRKKDWWEFLE